MNPKAGGIGKRLRQYREAKSFTVAELAKKIGISQGSLSKIELEKTSPSAETIVALLRETAININWLLWGVGEMSLEPVTPGLEIIERLAKALGILGLADSIKRLHNQNNMAKVLRITRKVEQELGLVPCGILPVDLIDQGLDLPYENVVRLCIRYGINLNWVYTGQGPMHRAEQEKLPSLNLDLLIEVKESLEKVLQKENIHLSIRKKAALEALLYDEMIEYPSKKSIFKERIAKLIKLQK
jgi:transcriptional regulator with XRE-family HTH domain